MPEIVTPENLSYLDIVDAVRELADEVQSYVSSYQKLGLGSGRRRRGEVSILDIAAPAASEHVEEELNALLEEVVLAATAQARTSSRSRVRGRGRASRVEAPSATGMTDPYAPVLDYYADLATVLIEVTGVFAWSLHEQTRGSAADLKKAVKDKALADEPTLDEYMFLPDLASVVLDEDAEDDFEDEEYDEEEFDGSGVVELRRAA